MVDFIKDFFTPTLLWCLIVGVLVFLYVYRYRTSRRSKIRSFEGAFISAYGVELPKPIVSEMFSQYGSNGVLKRMLNQPPYSLCIGRGSRVTVSLMEIDVDDCIYLLRGILEKREKKSEDD